MSRTPATARVVVVYPRGLQTGGPEALHQLVDSLRRGGHEAFLWPTPGTRHHERVADYDRYDAPETLADWDDRSTTVVFHEGAWALAGRWTRARRTCWWLSIDNSTLYGPRRTCALAWSEAPWRHRAYLAGRLLKGELRLLRTRWDARRVRHLAQSHYAAAYLERHGLSVAGMLSDYIADHPPADAREGTRDVLVLYNPKKGLAITQKVMGLVERSVQFRPIQGLDRQGVDELLRSAMVYLETGHQPGKDRLPREAALRGCVVLMLRKGAGADPADCPVPSEHKVNDDAQAAHQFAARVDDVAANPRRHRDLQRGYVAGLLEDRQQFDNEVRALFGSVSS